VHVDPPKLDVAKALAPPPAGTPTGVLDFELVSRPGAFVLRDQAYELTFPYAPKVSEITTNTVEGKPVPGLTAIAGDDSEDAYYSVSVTSFSRSMGVDPPKGLDGARDRILESVHAKLLSQAPVQIAGRTGRRIVASTVAEGKTVYIDARMLWDPDHRSIVILQSGALAADPSPKALAFFASLAVRPGRGSPLDGTPPADGSSVPANALDFALVRNGDTYTLRDDAIQIAFPSRPEVSLDTSLPAGAMAVQGEVYTAEREAYELTIFLVPKDSAYDEAMGITGTRNALVKAGAMIRPKETSEKIAGLAGKRIVATGKFLDFDAFYETEIVWDPAHHALISAVAITSSKATTPQGRAFLDSLAIHAAGATPH
jgi:hypothetical protein